MDLFASGLAMFVSLLWLLSIVASVKFGGMVFSWSGVPTRQKLHIFGLFVFAAQGIIVGLYFLISFLPFETQCYGMVDCQLTGILDGIKEQRWGYGAGALVAFAIAFFHFKNIDFTAKPNHEASN